MSSSEEEIEPKKIIIKTPGNKKELLKKKKYTSSSEEEEDISSKKNKKVTKKIIPRTLSSSEEESKISPIKRRDSSVDKSSTDTETSPLSKRGLGEFFIPQGINPSQHEDYIQGYNLYIQCSEKKYPKNIASLTENQIYFMAVIALQYKNEIPLRNLRSKLPSEKISDVYYWLYLSDDPKLLWSELEIEMCRRRTDDKLSLIDISNPNFRFRKVNAKNVLHNIKHELYSNGKLLSEDKKETVSCSDEIRPNGGITRTFITGKNFLTGFSESTGRYDFLNTNMNNPMDRLKNYAEEVTVLIDNILQLGGVIAGGFVNSLVNPVYQYFLIPWETIDYNNYGSFDDRVLNSLISAGEDEKIFIGIKPINRGVFSRRGLNLHLIHGFYDCVRAFYSRHPPSDVNKIARMRMKLDKELYSDYNLEAELYRLRECLIVIDNKLYFMVYQYSPDVDIFFVNTSKSNAQDKAHKVASLLFSKVQAYQELCDIHCSSYSTTFKFGKKIPKFQIIKRGYSSIDEILSGFDISSSRVALTLRAEKKVILAPQAYINALEYGINVVVPCRQSESFNIRLLKYENRGYRIHIPDNIIDSYLKKKYPVVPKIINKHDKSERKRISDFYKKILEHSLDYLYTYENNTSRAVRPMEQTDYDSVIGRKGTADEETEKEIKKDMVLIDRGERIPNMYELIYLTSYLIREIKSEINHYASNSTYTLPDMNKVKKHVFFIQHYRHLILYLNSCFWRSIDPMSQYTGSFNPTFVDYLASTQVKKKKRNVPLFDTDIITLKSLSEYFPSDITDVIFSYTNYIHDVFSEVRNIDRLFLKMNIDKILFEDKEDKTSSGKQKRVSSSQSDIEPESN
jgi:hypothetical protein